MIPIKKKNNATACKDYRTISLLPHAAKIMLKIITKRIQAKVEADNGLGDQFGFRKGRGTRDAIGSLRVLAERSLEHGQEVYICFVDYEKAFDRVDWRKLMTPLRRKGIDWKDEPKSKDKNRWRMFRGRRNWKGSKTRMSSIITPLQHIYRRAN